MIKIIVGLLAIAVPLYAFKLMGQLLRTLVEYYSMSDRTITSFKREWRVAGRDVEECFWIGAMLTFIIVAIGFIGWGLGNLIL